MADLINYLKSSEGLAGLIAFFTKIGISILVIILGGILIKVTNKFIHKTIFSSSKISQRKANTLNTVCSSVTRYCIYFFVLCEILTIFGINITSLIAIAGVGSVAIGLGARSLVEDLIIGLFILVEDQFGVGDFVAVEGCSGKVESIGIRTTRIRSADGNLHIVPNGQIKIVTNMSKGFNRAIVDIGIAYEENLDKVLKVMEDEMKKAYENNLIEGLISVPDVMGVVNLGESSVDIRISADSHVGENWKIEREIRRLIKNRLDKEKINIPYPQRVVHIINKEGGI